MAWHAGQEGGQAIAEILTGKLSPSGRLPISIERTEADNPSSAYYHATSNPRWESARIDYGEGIFTGYRGYDRMGSEASLSFRSRTELYYFRLFRAEGDAVYLPTV